MHRRSAALHDLIQSILRYYDIQALLSLKFPRHLEPEVDSVLSTLARKYLPFSPTQTETPQYHQVLYTYRIHVQNFHGAAEILFERLQKLQHTTAKVFEPDDETLLEAYLVLINTLA